MPRTKTHLSASEYAVLGLLRQKPAYGYELQRKLSAAQGLGRVCPVEPAMVYAILKSLAGLELIDGEWDNRAYPPRAVYAATAEGEAAFQRWLRQPVARVREVRRDFLVKLYFALEESLPAALELLDAQTRAIAAYQDAIERELAAAQAGSFDAIVLESKQTAARITLEWLRDVRGELEARGASGAVL